MASTLEQDHEKIRQTCLNVPLVDAHAHNVVALDSNLPFLRCLSDERGHETLSGVPLSLAYQVRLSCTCKFYSCHFAKSCTLLKPQSNTSAVGRDKPDGFGNLHEQAGENSGLQDQAYKYIAFCRVLLLKV